MAVFKAASLDDEKSVANSILRVFMAFLTRLGELTRNNTGFFVAPIIPLHGT
jgi:hypothetical protein